MPKQEEIREGIAHQQVTMPLNMPKQFVGTDLADRIIEYLHSQGVVIKVERELPKSPDTDYLISQYEGEEATAEDVTLMHLNGIEKGKSLMLRAGYVAVEPLM